MDKKVQIILRKISQYCIYIIAFITPILFLPITSDYYEFNKGFIVILLTMIGTTTWAFSLDPAEEISIWKSKFDKPLFFLILISFVSTLFSKHYLTSLIGFSGTITNSLLFFFTLLLLSFLARNVLIGKKSIDKLIWSISFSGTLIALISILQYWGIYIFKFLDVLKFTAYRKFTLLGYESVLPFFLMLLIPLELYFYKINRRDNKLKMFSIFSIFITIYSLILTSGKIWTWPAFLVLPASILLGFYTVKNLKIEFDLSKQTYIPILVGIILLFLVHNIPFIENKIITTKSFYSVQPTLSLDTSWKILTNQYADSAKELLFGAGPDTYAYTFSKYKPAAYSSSENAGIRFARSSTQLIEIASNYGLVGVAAWIFLFITIIKITKKIFSAERDSEYKPLLKLFSTIIVVVLISGIFVFFTSIFWIFIWISIGIISTSYILHFPKEAKRISLSLSLSKGIITPKKQNVLPFVFKSVSLVMTLVSLTFLIRLYIGEVFYMFGKNVGTSDAENDEEIIRNYIEANNHFSDAIRFTSIRDDYYSDRAIVEIKLLEKSVDLLIKEGDTKGFTSEQDRLTNLSLDSLRSALTLNPVNVRGYKSAVYIYETLMNLTEGEYATELLGSINSGLELDPNDPELHHKKGIVLFLAERDGATDEIKRAIELDPLYLQAYLDLASINHSDGDFASAQKNLERLIEIMDNQKLQELDIYQEIKKNIDNYERGYTPDNLDFQTIESTEEIIEEESDTEN